MSNTARPQSRRACESGCSAQRSYLLLFLHLKKFVHDDAEYPYQTGRQGNLMILSFRYPAS